MLGCQCALGYQLGAAMEEREERPRKVLERLRVYEEFQDDIVIFYIYFVFLLSCRTIYMNERLICVI